MTIRLADRKLNDGQDINSKQDFMFENASHPQLWNKNTVKFEHPYGDWVYGETLSVGKGQVIYFSGSGGDNTYIMYLADKKGNRLQELIIDKWDNGSVYYPTDRVATFIGQPFIADGDYDRYIVFGATQISGQPNTWNFILFNIDTWTVKKILGGTNEGHFFDFVYDGDKTIYGAWNQNGAISNLYTWNIETDAFVSPQDTTGNYLYAKSIIGVNDKYLFFHNNEMRVKRYEFSTKTIAQTAETTGSKMIGSDWIIYTEQPSGTFGGIYLDGSFTGSGNSAYHLNQSLVDAVLIAPNELNIVPKLILNLDISGDTLTFDWILLRKNYESINYVNTTINTATGTIVSSGLYTQDTPNANTSWYNNSLNCYNLGKFYDYGLQKQWDNR